MIMTAFCVMMRLQTSPVMMRMLQKEYIVIMILLEYIEFTERGLCLYGPLMKKILQSRGLK